MSSCPEVFSDLLDLFGKLLLIVFNVYFLAEDLVLLLPVDLRHLLESEVERRYASLDAEEFLRGLKRDHLVRIYLFMHCLILLLGHVIL